MRSQGFPDHTRWRHLTFGGPSHGALKLFFFTAIPEIKTGFYWLLGSGLCPQEQIFACVLQASCRNSVADSGRVWGRSGVFCPAVWSHTTKEKKAQWRFQTSWTDLAVAINPCMWKCLSRLHLIHLEFWIIALMYRKYTAWSQHDN